MASGRTPYHRLMRRRISEVLVVASAYDSFVLEEEGSMGDHIFQQYRELNLSDAPHFTRVATGRQALAALGSTPYDLVITSSFASDMPPEELARRVRARRRRVPVVMLTYDPSLARTYAALPRDGLDEVLQWTGDPRVLLTLVKLVEDRVNVAEDIRLGGVRVIVVVEDSPDWASAFLSLMYTELLVQTRRLLADVLNEADRHYRMRARPKILLARTYEEATALVRRYRRHLLGAVVDLRFPRGGKEQPQAGLDLVRHLRQRLPELPILLQSAEIDPALAERLGVVVADKGAPDLLARLRAFMRDHLGFGPFVFRMPDGAEVARADDLSTMVRVLPSVPAASIRHHAEHNDFSNWLTARTEFPLADELRPRRAEEFTRDEAIRDYLLASLRRFLEDRQRGLVTDYRQGSDPLRQRDFTRIGRGSMGGKSRGLAFLAHILAGHPLHARFPGLRIGVPRTLVLCTGVFDAFCESGDLVRRAMALDDDAEIERLFLEQPLSPELLADLAAILADVHHPLAVRSSSLMEDSVHQPLAGLYATRILPNQGPLEQRLDELSWAIRVVYASTFFREPRAYLDAVGARLEEERMAVVVQRLVGRQHGERFYPDFAGVAQSHNFYPVRYLQPEDGIASVALGLGDLVVEGGSAYRFCPRHPEVVPEMSRPADVLRNTQREFYALDLSEAAHAPGAPLRGFRRRHPLAVAEADGTLGAVASTWVAEDDRIRDTIAVPGTRVVRFAPVLQHGLFPLAAVLDALLQVGVDGMGGPVELEFAACLGPEPELAVVQMRPLVHASELSQAVSDAPAEGEACVVEGPALGHGVIDGLQDVVIAWPEGFDRGRTPQIAAEVERLNHLLAQAGRNYVLVGPGRWGSADPWLGVPVTWPQVSAARVIVELAQPDLRVEPSQGTHFFHNITGLRIGYFTVDPAVEGQALDLGWLAGLPVASEAQGVRHYRLDQPLCARIEGRRRHGVVVRSTAG